MGHTPGSCPPSDDSIDGRQPELCARDGHRPLDHPPAATTSVNQSPAPGTATKAATTIAHNKQICYRELQGRTCTLTSPSGNRPKRDRPCGRRHLKDRIHYDDAQHGLLMDFVRLSKSAAYGPILEDKLRQLRGINDAQVNEILQASNARTATSSTAAAATPSSKATGAALAAAQPAPLTGNHAVGKMVAKSSPSHNAAEWACVYTNLFSTDATWKDSKACYEYFDSL